MSLTNYGEQKILDHILRNTAFPSVNPYLALFKSNPGEGGIVSGEVSGGGYVRQPVVFSEISSEGEMKNSAVVTFPEATDAWGLITHWGIMDSQSGGNMILYGDVDEAKQVGKSDLIKFNQGNLTVTID